MADTKSESGPQLSGCNLSLIESLSISHSNRLLSDTRDRKQCSLVSRISLASTRRAFLNASLVSYLAELCYMIHGVVERHGQYIGTGIGNGHCVVVE